MNDIHSGIGSATSEHIAAPGIADWLCLAAAPTFAVMALLSCVQGGEAAMLCMGSSPLTGPSLTSASLTGMPAMYLLMSAFHLAPWLRVISGRQAR
ncbi:MULTISPECIES: hypothetical protein [Mesorhizobium]|jgi:hypothetical protein|uniref:Uncharacterized protein n=1 Tax=Mesorhizobium opportunistum (strain LMG 24607 / HAMBI 3007 / WSM2075) TaxID=536019 RepID=F7YBH8_MESOW|nr:MULTISPECIES: hypothetical protein [Mesorhizobium]AEH87725.1 conserved hypothetical protein [Mesorhizobium opportunistum WSM2075]MCA0035241.1 hypothetical protein [Mesorhizobium sp. B263B2A]TPN42933.1 hypothetical protein FJ976_29580 [Mesorhizobium sp. B1-1-9]TPN43503.1 hypothetical protein FJ978_30885 [Mesorhizobium sp. B1-1-7]